MRVANGSEDTADMDAWFAAAVQIEPRQRGDLADVFQTL